MNKTTKWLTPSRRHILASVKDIPANLTLADFGLGYYVEGLKKSGTASNIRIISNKPIILKDGTKAYRTEYEYLYATGGWEVGTVVVSAFRNEKLVFLEIHAPAGEQSDAAWIVESLTFN